MWRLRCEAGRQCWEYDESTPLSEADRQVAAQIEQARSAFEASRHERRQAADQVFRLQAVQQPTGGASGSALDALFAQHRVEDGDREDDVEAALVRGACAFARLQVRDGHWPGDYGGPLFLLPGLLIACYISGTPLSSQHVHEMRRYLFNMQRRDGGWGLHIEAPSSMFGSVMNYVALRLLGVEASEARLAQARAFIHRHGGAVGIPSWGKFWLACLGCYDWRGLNPLTPEMWLLPYGSGDATGARRPAIGWLANPVMPARYWCHCRMVYLPMSDLYGRRATGPLTPLVQSLRRELYTDAYDRIDWPAQRFHCCALDEYTHRPRVQRWLWNVLYVYEWTRRWPLAYLRDRVWRPRALAETRRQVRAEDRNTKHVCIGPVNKAINLLVCWFDHESPDAEAHFRAHQERVQDYLWLAEDGMKMQGYNGSQLWDTAFAVQALAECGDLWAAKAGSPLRDTLAAAWRYLEVSQVLEDVPDAARYYRHISRGAWPFSTRDHGWPISDCTAEGLRAVLALRRLFRDEPAMLSPPIPDHRLDDALNVMLSFQNPSGGWATYENTRSYPWLEWLNPSEVFDDIMIDWDHVECTSACVRSLIEYAREFPQHARTAEMRTAVERGLTFIRQVQRADGSWYGNWGVCFTYGTWFAVEALVAGGATVDTCPALQRACAFLEAHQHPSGEGGWGETYESCSHKRWHHAPEVQTVNTAWALMSLLAAGWHQRGEAERHTVQRAAQWLLRAQRRKDGFWEQQLIKGVFNRNCMITYNYETVFALWALARYRNAQLGASLPHSF